MSPRPTRDLQLLRHAARAGTPALLRRVLGKLGPTDLARLFADLSPAESKLVVEHLLEDAGRLTQTIQALPNGLLRRTLERFSPQLLGRVLNCLAPDDSTRLAHLLDDERREASLAHTTVPRRDQIAQLMRYERESAGGKMTPRFAASAPDTRVGAAIDHIRTLGDDVPLFYLYVVDDAGVLLGVVSLARLVKASDDTPLAAIMHRDIHTVPPAADQEFVARVVSEHNLLSVPVVSEGRILGVITIDDVIDVLEKEATEDIYNMAGLREGDRVFSSPLRSLAKRLPWNMLNLLTAIMAAFVVSRFEKTIAQMVALATFMPIVAGIGGNTGNQTLTVIIRGITLGELEFSSGVRALLKEIIVGLSIGLLLGAIVAVLAYSWTESEMLGVVVALSIVANLVLAALVGTAIPLTLKRLGLDPALGGSILVTMCTDIFGFLVFLGLATLFLPTLI